MDLFVTAIGTDSGKTLASAILCEALGADYWKPVQAGLPGDSAQIMQWVSHEQTIAHPERYMLKMPASPHAAAAAEGKKIALSDFVRPATTKHLVIEGAGGCLVPLNEEAFVIDLAVKLNTPVVLVANLYLGSINHTLLTVEALKKRSLFVKGIIFNGARNPASEEIILRHSAYQKLLHIHPENSITKQIVKSYAEKIRSVLQ